mmetsp:Transcript_7456/g.12606  ORF Transcript_7456/g.12606 Transcript_7456/m.12606 type:complete len:172 (-) Transcript_7456:500-1015(-)
MENIAGLIRKAAKAGSWYERNPQKLNNELQSYLNNSQLTLKPKAGHKLKAVIGPHAGFAYSGPTAAWAYKNIEPKLYDRVVLLGPSHSLGFDSLAMTECSQWETPFGNIDIDHAALDKIMQNPKSEGLFIRLPKKYDENEHSLELHLPFIHKVFLDQKKDFKLIPFMVGQI